MKQPRRLARLRHTELRRIIGPDGKWRGYAKIAPAMQRSNRAESQQSPE
jgi:hypothetical protein